MYEDWPVHHFGSRDRVQTSFLYSLYSVVTLKIRSMSPKFNQDFKPSQQSGQNPSSGSRESAYKLFFGQNLKISNGVLYKENEDV